MAAIPRFCSILLLSGLVQPITANWAVNLYKKGCPKGDNIDDPGVQLVGSTAGQAKQEIWCYQVDSAHAAFLDGIVADSMKVDVFADSQCSNLIETWTSDGCIVVNSDPNTVISGARIVPK